MNQIKNPMDNFGGGLTPTMNDVAQQFRMKDEMGRSMKSNQLQGVQPHGEAQEIRLADIRTDGDIRIRIDISPFVQDNYVQLMEAGTEFPPVLVIYDGTDYWLADGFYRLGAAKQLGREFILASVRAGDKRKAKLEAIAANRAHGVPYTTRDKQNAFLALAGDPEWSRLSNVEKANQLGVREGTIRNYYKRFQDLLDKWGTSQLTNIRVCRRGNQVFEMDTSGQSTKSSKKAGERKTGDISAAIMESVQHLQFVDDPAQVRDFMCLSQEDQVDVAKILRGDKVPAKVRTVHNAVLKLRWDRLENDHAESLEARRKLALDLGLDRNFVLGDCTDEAVLGALPDRSIRLLLADGPYGIGYTSSSDYRESMARIPNDKCLEDALEVHRGMLRAVASKMMSDCHVMLFCDKKFEPDFRTVLLEAGYEYKDSLIWDKDDAGHPIPNQAMRRHERILWFTKGHLQLNGIIGDVLRHPRPHSKFRNSDGSHLTPKPESLLMDLISVATVENELVFDPFSGSASTLVAAQKLNRRFFGTEHEAKWHKVGLARLAGLDEEAEVLAFPREPTLSFNTYQAATDLAA